MSDQHEQKEDLKRNVTNMPADELNEEELGTVSGGFNPQPEPPGDRIKGNPNVSRGSFDAFLKIEGVAGESK